MRRVGKGQKLARWVKHVVKLNPATHFDGGKCPAQFCGDEAQGASPSQTRATGRNLKTQSFVSSRPLGFSDRGACFRSVILWDGAVLCSRWGSCDKLAQQREQTVSACISAARHHFGSSESMEQSHWIQVRHCLFGETCLDPLTQWWHGKRGFVRPRQENPSRFDP